MIRSITQDDKIVITGGSGFLGINMIRHLLSKGYRKITNIDIADFDYPEQKLIETIKGDIRDINAVKIAVNGAKAVIHTAAALPLYKKEEIYSTDINGTEIVVSESEKAGVNRFVHISSTAVYGIPDHHPLIEEDRLSGVGHYGKAKIEAEKICESYRSDRMAVTIIRPKSFIGPERLGVFALFYDWVKDGKNFPMLGSGRNRYQFLDVADLCEAIYLSLTKEEADKINNVFNIGAENFATMREDYQAVLDYAGYHKKIIPFPAYPVITALRVLEVFKLSPLYKWVYETAHKDSFVSIDKAKKLLGYQPVYSNKEALIRNYRWYIENIDNFKNQSGVSHRVPWKQGILKLFKLFF